MKVCEICGDEIYTRDGENRCKNCDENENPKPVEKKRRKRNRSAMHEAMESIGLVRVRGALGGVYYE